jgi:hypothetical protein
MPFAACSLYCFWLLQGPCPEVATGSGVLQALPTSVRLARNLPARNTRAAVASSSWTLSAAKFDGRQAAREGAATACAGAWAGGASGEGCYLECYLSFKLAAQLFEAADELQQTNTNTEPGSF